MSLADYRTLGASGLIVSPFCLGAMGFGDPDGFGVDTKESRRIIDHYIAEGGNFIDTSNFYSHGRSEEILGDHLGQDPAKRASVVIATKFSANLRAGDPNSGGAGRGAIIEACEASLRRLQTDHIDLYWQHWEDPFVPVEETMLALNDLVSAGKVRYIGFSDTSAWKTAKAHAIAIFKGWTPLIALQFEYSLLERTCEAELIPLALDADLGITPWSPLRGGMLSGKYGRASLSPDSPGRELRLKGDATEATFEIVDLLKEVARRNDVTPACAALAWLRAKPGVTSPIIGARAIEQLDDNLKALSVSLPERDLVALDEITRPRLAFPADFLRQAQNLSYTDLSVNGRKFEIPAGA